jgi:hypothetical protein
MSKGRVEVRKVRGRVKGEAVVGVMSQVTPGVANFE